MKQKYARQAAQSRKPKPPPDLVRALLDHLDYREDMAPGPKTDIRFTAADALVDTYFRLLTDMPDCIRRNMSLHAVIDKATSMLNGDGIIPAGSGAVPTQTERDYWTRRFPGQQYTPSTNGKPKP